MDPVTSSDYSSNVEYYDQLADEYSLFFQNLDQNMEQEGAWLDSVLRAHRVRRVLDASCGTGRQAIPLSERGYDVVAADPSASMLHEAERKANERHQKVPLIQAAFADLTTHVGRDFDAVIAMGNGLCNQEQAAMIQESLASMHQCCRGGSICIVGIKDFEKIRREFEPFHGHQVDDKHGKRTILFEVWDMRDPVLLCTAVVLEGQTPTPQSDLSEWTTRTRTTCEYMLMPEELEHLATSAGFHGIERLDHPSEAVFLLRA
ncbi:MAG: hypothetical protein NVS2B16_29190 [Chloroflexota bacterium]